MPNIFPQHMYRNKFRVTVYSPDLDYNLEATFKACFCTRHSPNSILPWLNLTNVPVRSHTSARGQH